MGLILLLVVLVLLFGGGGFYVGPPFHYFGGGPQPDTGDRHGGHSVQALIVRALTSGPMQVPSGRLGLCWISLLLCGAYNLTDN